MKEPKIRFKGFEGEWEKVKLGEICSKSNSLHSENSLGTNIGKYPIFGANGYLQNITTFDFNSPYIGIIKDGSGVGRSQLYPAFSSILGTMQYILPKEDINISFLAYLFETIDFSMYINGSSIPHIYFKDYCEQDEYIPSIAEQRAIASYFQHLDALIQSTTKKIESLKQVKAASLQSMFPQEGETTPRVRFKGFEGEWEKVKIRDVCSKANSTHSQNSLGENTGNYPIFGANGYLQNITTFDFGFPYIGIIKDGSGVGRSQLYPAFSSILGTMQYILPKGDINISFLAYLFETIEFSMYINGSSIPHIYFNDYCEEDKYIPSIAEQRVIASYFTTLDRQITLQSQRLEKLKQIKAACLDNMFV